MTQRIVRRGVLAAFLVCLWPAAEAAIVQDQQLITGQSFTADASVAQLSSIEFYYLNTNTALPAARR